ncbi:TFIIH/NER complex subunit [Gnomoniopsis sp. IMI 355080]|nr:TFIIH/NER complex subunit [Gnomoniopsis sp. IMI 355080]
MSRPPPSRSGGLAAPTTTTNADGEEQCPICKTLRYMNPTMVFLINTCYHPLCNNCVDRLFENGPNQCPYVNCHLTLRKRAFRTPTFADLTVEREVDIRRRVAAVFNKTEADFESLRDYNDYLDMVESLTMDLVYGDDRAHRAADTKLRAWEDEHRAEIERNRRQGERAREQTKKHFAAEQKAAAARRAEAAKLEEEERREKARQREEDLDMLASAPQGMANKVLLKKRGQERAEAAAEREAAALRRAAAAASGEFTIKGLKKKPTATAVSAVEDSGPYAPFGNVNLRPSRYTVQDRYKNEILDGLRSDPAQLAGGYSFAEYYSRALFEAFAGLAVFVADEKGQDSLHEVATIEAGMAAADEPSLGLPVNADVSSRGGTTRGAAEDSEGDVQMTDVAGPEQPATMTPMDVEAF